MILRRLDSGGRIYEGREIRVWKIKESIIGIPVTGAISEKTINGGETINDGEIKWDAELHRAITDEAAVHTFVSTDLLPFLHHECDSDYSRAKLPVIGDDGNPRMTTPGLVAGDVLAEQGTKSHSCCCGLYYDMVRERWQRMFTT